MNLNTIKNILGISPELGDIVSGYTDFNIMFIGEIVQDNSKNLLPHYRIKGTIYIDNAFRGLLYYEEGDNPIECYRCSHGVTEQIQHIIDSRKKEGRFFRTKKVDNYLEDIDGL